jgi:hypothetical protein
LSKRFRRRLQPSASKSRFSPPVPAATLTTSLPPSHKSELTQCWSPPIFLFFNRRIQLFGLSLRHVVPSLYQWREAVEIGGLMIYGTDFADLYRQAGIYTGRVLKGEKTADLPVLQASKFEFVLNLQTANVLGIEVPPGVLSIADEVIE